MKKGKGFTLIELLVVISIIAILAAIGLVIYGSTQKNGRVSKRLQDLRALKLAAEESKVDNTSYPTTAGKWYIWYASGGGTNCTTVPAPAGTNTATAPSNLTPQYIASLPTDPSDGCYAYISDGNNYKFIAFGATEMKLADYQKQQSYADSNSSRTLDWAAFNDPAATAAW